MQLLMFYFIRKLIKRYYVITPVIEDPQVDNVQTPEKKHFEVYKASGSSPQTLQLSIEDWALRTEDWNLTWSGQSEGQDQNR